MTKIAKIVLIFILIFVLSGFVVDKKPEYPDLLSDLQVIKADVKRIRNYLANK